MRLEAQLGFRLLGIGGTVRRGDHTAVLKHCEEWIAKHGPDPLVRLRADICAKARNGSMSVREFRTLVAIYSSIGRNACRGITQPIIRMRAIGCKSAGVMNAENGSLPLIMTEKEARGTITRLHELGFFARVTPIRHGRKTFYSHRLTESELIARMSVRYTHSRKFVEEQRQKSQALEQSIRKGDYNSEEKGHYNGGGRQEGDARATEGQREGDLNRNTLNRKPIDKKPDDRYPTGLQPTSSNPHPIPAMAQGLAAKTVGKEEIEYGFASDGVLWVSTPQMNELFAKHPERWKELTEKFYRTISINGVVSKKP